MTNKTIKLISPVDGSLYAERPVLTEAQADAAVARAKAAQVGWAALPLADRIAAVRACLVTLNGMADRMVQELAWQMGRPTRYGGEFGGMNERSNYMLSIAEATLAPQIVEDSGNSTAGSSGRQWAWFS